MEGLCRPDLLGNPPVNACVTPLVHDRTMYRAVMHPGLGSARWYTPPGVEQGDLIEVWPCQVCDHPIPIVFRPGRPRLYCTNACRQRAYRWRKRNGVRTTVTPDSPTDIGYTRSHVPFRSHALRTRRDPMSRRVDSRRREVTVCGLLAKPTFNRKLPRSPFRPDSVWACETCRSLTAPSPPVDSG
jgi:hypothetical protein